jgi:hypothetical protein
MRLSGEKKAPGRPGKLYQADTVSTRQRLAAEHGVGEATISRDAVFAAAVNTIADTVGIDTRNAILKRNSGLTKKDAIDWLIEENLGRRNLTELQKSYLRGLRFTREKKAPYRPEKGAHCEPLKTAERIASESNVSRETVKRDADYANAVNVIADTVGPGARDAILKRNSGLTKKDVIALADEDPETQAKRP